MYRETPQWLSVFNEDSADPRLSKQLASRDNIEVAHSGDLSAPREAILPSLRKHKTLYFYNVQYEGGVCDRNLVCTGITPAQQVEVLVPDAVTRFGKKAYILAADYNYGQIMAKWFEHYLKVSVQLKALYKAPTLAHRLLPNLSTRSFPHDSTLRPPQRPAMATDL